MTELKDLKVGDEVTLTIKGDVTEVAEDGVYIDYGDFDEIWILTHEEVSSGRVTIDRAPRPLPTEDGIYVASHLIRGGYNLNQAAVVKISGGCWYGEKGNFDTAEEYAKYLFDQYGLTRVRLVPEQ